ALSTAELVLLQKLDLAELHRFELARDLSISLLKEWLTQYKFKDWTVTETSRTPVTTKMRENRAEEIARKLNNHTKWLTHGRGIDMDTLRGELKLKIDDLDGYPDLKVAAWDYFWFTNSYMQASGNPSFVHTPNFF
ncbi:MAG: serine dehydrogenasease, partial [bacterium]|nr:serine dehydrogenasease [bacterium]